MTQKTNAVTLMDAGPLPLRPPYKIQPAVCPSKEAANELDPWVVQEFFRVEALLRSEIVMRLYQKDKAAGCLAHLRKKSYFKEPYIGLTREDAKNDSLHKEYKVAGGWLALLGFHHRYLSLERTTRVLGSRGSPIISGSIENVTEHLLIALRAGPEPFQAFLKHITAMLSRDTEKDKGKQYLWLRIDAAFPPHTILNIIKPTLMTMHRALGPVGWRQIGPIMFHPHERPLIRGYTGIRKWFDCLACYDLSIGTPKLSFGRIARQVYGVRTSQTYDRAENCCKRFRRLIAAAESDQFPPIGIK